jgi:hypothetical protein
MQGSGEVIDYLTYQTLVGHINLNKELIINLYEGLYLCMFYSFSLTL